MEKFAYKIKEMLQEKISLYQKLLGILSREKRYIVDMDLDSLWKITEEKQKLARSIEGVKERILYIAGQQPAIHESGRSVPDLDTVISNLPVPKDTKSDMKKTKIDLDALKKEVSLAASENKEYVEEYLGVIQDIFSKATEKATERKYSSSGSVKQNQQSNHFIRAEV
ncbi:MAG: flagellar export chaperone FlgN [Thermodesulfobacteriota bacterium]